MNLTIDRDDVQAFIATLPADPERDRRAATLRAAANAFTDAMERKRDIAARSEQIANDLVDATGKRRDELVHERGAIGSELAMFPTTIRIATARFAEALTNWGTHVYLQARQVHDEASAAIGATSEQRRSLIHRLTELESATRYADQVAAVRADYAKVCATLQPHYQRQTQARDVSQAIEGELRNRFGEGARGGNVSQLYIDRYVTNVTRKAA